MKVDQIFRIPNSVYQLKKALTVSPVLVYVDTSDFGFKFYRTGILTSKNCPQKPKVSHVMTAVGYGKHNGQDYFILKNSWGTGWGEKGFMRIHAEESPNGTCGMLMNNYVGSVKDADPSLVTTTS